MEQKLKTSEIISFSLGYMGLTIGGLFGSYLSFYWTDIVIIPLAAVASIQLISRLLDGVTDIIIGFLVDKTKTKYGKARPWILWMVGPAVLSIIGTFSMSPNWSTGFKVAYAFILYNCVAFFLQTAITIPMQTLSSLMTKVAKERLKLNMTAQAFGSAMSTLGQLVVVAGIAMFGGGQGGYLKFFGLTAILAGALFLVAFKGTKEHVQAVTNKLEKMSVGTGFKLLFSNKYWVWVTLLQVTSWFFPAFMAINIYYMIWIYGDPSLMGPFMSLIFFSMFIAVLVLGPLSMKIGKGATATLGMILQVIGGLLPLFGATLPILMASAIFRGSGPAAMLGTRLAFTADVVEYGEWKTGRRTEGLIFSGTSMGQKIGMGLGGALVAVFLDIGGYVGGATVQTASALNAIVFTFTWASALASLLAVVCLAMLSRMNKMMPQILADLEARAAENATEEVDAPEETEE